MYIADCLYMGSEVEIIAKNEVVLKTLISSIAGDIDVLDVTTDEERNEGCRGCEEPLTACRKCMQDYYWLNIEHYL